MNKILPNIDLNNSRDFYGSYNTRDLYKGKSFNMAGEWKAGAHYFNDDSLQDFVSYNGVLLSCNKSHIATSNTEPKIKYRIEDGIQIPEGIINTSYWTFVLAGIPGKTKIYIPKYDSSTGILTWDVSYDESEIEPMNIKGAGITSISDETSDDGKFQKLTIQYGDGEEEVIELPHGKDGKNGDTYKPDISEFENNKITISFVNNNDNTVRISHEIDFSDTIDKIQSEVKNDVTPSFKIEDNILKVSFNGETWEQVGSIYKTDSLDGGEITL